VTALESNKENIEINIMKLNFLKPEEKIEFPLLIDEIKVLPLNYSGLNGRIPWLEQGTYCATLSCSTY
jgi:hypothetical protein